MAARDAKVKAAQAQAVAEGADADKAGRDMLEQMSEAQRAAAQACQLAGGGENDEEDQDDDGEQAAVAATPAAEVAQNGTAGGAGVSEAQKRATVRRSFNVWQ